MATSSEKEILAFDYGGARIGLARANSIARLAEPLGVIANTDQAVTEAISQHRPDELVVGLPRSLKGQQTEQTRLTLEFATSLKKHGLPVHLQDEALTSVAAENQAFRFKPSTPLDAIAAAIILEDFLKEQL